jgi:hypothetical protein
MIRRSEVWLILALCFVLGLWTGALVGVGLL